jgi:ribonuclease P protein component
MSSDEKLPKKERLIKTSDFGKVYNKGSSFSSESFILKILPNTLNLNRIGFSISSRSIKKAFRRNRIRRLFREVFRKNKKELKKGFDMVLIVRKDPGASFSYKEAEGIFVKLSKRIKASA